MSAVARILAAAVGTYPRRLVANLVLANRRGAHRSVTAAVELPTLAVLVVSGIVWVVAVALVADARVTAAVPDLPGAVRAFFGRLTHLGDSDWILIPSGLVPIVVGLGNWRRTRRRSAAAWAEIAAFAAAVFLTVAAAGLFTDLLKIVFGRMRPAFAEGVLDFLPFAFGGYPNYSFPSGHATVAGAVAAIFLFGPRSWRLPALVVSLFVGASRFVIGVHFPSDVLAGLLVGAGIAYLIVSYFADKGFGFRRGNDGWPTWRLAIVRQRLADRGGLSSLAPPLWLALRAGGIDEGQPGAADRSA